ncbi:hypothetical protein RCIX18 [Methanocella arvoryzae MRE50]|uniref:Uncharacterized protein n=1 Tax=Methanocella arvoryzae (strain DSM 22066 / NBRC 105507 / MRE50) TaxID=351160 RepID=Q0W7V5_METAR|nr:hypothetical protein RCIX18 [Methanocella arvoryzae MRE50]
MMPHRGAHANSDHLALYRLPDLLVIHEEHGPVECWPAVDGGFADRRRSGGPVVDDLDAQAFEAFYGILDLRGDHEGHVALAVDADDEHVLAGVAEVDLFRLRGDLVTPDRVPQEIPLRGVAGDLDSVFEPVALVEVVLHDGRSFQCQHVHELALLVSQRLVEPLPGEHVIQNRLADRDAGVLLVPPAVDDHRPGQVGREQPQRVSGGRNTLHKARGLAAPVVGDHTHGAVFPDHLQQPLPPRLPTLLEVRVLIQARHVAANAHQVIHVFLGDVFELEVHSIFIPGHGLTDGGQS